MQKATAFLDNGDLENCALELRKLGEIIFKNFLEKKKPEIFKTKEYFAFGKMLQEAKIIISQSVVAKFQKNILDLNLTDEEWAHVAAENFNEIKISTDIHKNSKKKIFAARKAIFDTAKSVKTETNEAFQFVDKVINIKDRLLNYGAHPSDDTLFKTEMEEAIALFDNLQSVLNAV